LGAVKKWENGTADSDGSYWHQWPAWSDAATLTNNGDEALAVAMTLTRMTRMTMTMMAMMAMMAMMMMESLEWQWQQ